MFWLSTSSDSSVLCRVVCPIFITTFGYTTALQLSYVLMKMRHTLSLRFKDLQDLVLATCRAKSATLPPQNHNKPRVCCTCGWHSSVPPSPIPLPTNISSGNQWVIWFPYEMKLHHEMKSNGLHKNSTSASEPATRNLSPLSGVYFAFSKSITSAPFLHVNHNVLVYLH